MADDGLLLNFSFGDAPLAAKSNVTGATWRARRRIQKQGQHEPTLNPNEIERPAKRLKTAQPLDAVREFRSRPIQKHGQDAPKQVISSLFSFNPTPTTVSAPKPVDANVVEEQIEPSNAPLTAEQEGLVKMGLSTVLAAHLTNKMGITAPTAIQKAALGPLLSSDADAFIQAETGSGKTLAYLLPIVQRLMQTTDGGAKLHRHSGLFAIILAPTRELSKQISVVLESLLRCVHWLVPGTVLGGEKKKSEKARLRKGLNILVATPGRLADHLSHTEVLDVSNVRWLVLDEGDRLMELGFEEDIKKIVSKLNFAQGAKKSLIAGLPESRINILCSATMKMDVQKLGEISLKDATHIRNEAAASGGEGDAESAEKAFSAPAQLKQSYVIVPAKLRLVTLIAQLKRTFVRRGAITKAIVFMSCADSVDFHYEVLASTIMGEKKESSETRSQESKQNSDKSDKPKDTPTSIPEQSTYAKSPMISNDQNNVKVYRLHGSLPQAMRTQTLRAFSQDKEPAFLVCTDVASRGLDLPNVDLVIEYDPPFSKEEHLHRIGRTARAGRDGRASVFLQPGCEEGYIEILKEGRRDNGLGLTRHMANEIMRKGFPIKDESGRERETGWEERATELQLHIERWALENTKMLEMARRAFQSHIRAYATHVAAERHMFDMKQLHLGHLCKAFGLRDKPGSINVPGLRQSAGKVKSDRYKAGSGQRDAARHGNGNGNGGEDDDVELSEAAQQAIDARRKMRMMSKAMASGSGEFNLA